MEKTKEKTDGVCVCVHTHWVLHKKGEMNLEISRKRDTGFREEGEMVSK